MPATAIAKPKRSKSRPARSPEVVSFQFSNHKTLSGAHVDENRALNWSACYRAVCILSQAIAGLTLEVRRKEVVDGRIRRPLVPDHPVNDLLEVSPNDEQTPYVFKEYGVQCMCKSGNFFAVPQRRAGSEFPVALWPLDPKRVAVQRDADTGRLRYRYTEWSGGTVEYAPDEIIHVPMPGDGIVGKSPLSMARETIGLALATEAAGASLFGNGLMPSGVFEHPGKMSPKARKDIEEYLERHVGQGKNRRFLVMEKGTQWIQMGIPPEDAQFLGTRKFQIVEVSRWYGIPPHMLGDVEGSKYASIAPMQIEFVLYALKTYALRIEQELTRKLLPRGSGLFIRFDLEDIMRGDLEAQSKYFREFWGIGVLSTNEIREKLDLDDVEDGDKRAAPQNMTTLEKLGETPEKPNIAGPGNGGDQGTPENGAPRALVAPVFRDAACRIVNKEVKCISRLVEKNANDSILDAAIRDFYSRYEGDVAQTFGPSWSVIGTMTKRSAKPELGASKYVAASRELVLQALRSGGRGMLSKVLEAWRSVRADAVTEEFMEAAFLN